uniref:Uncharacterized protein n=1 Tax=Alexandrium catenella TaxID=2925 RepID=A0A7S1RJX5_ALECA
MYSLRKVGKGYMPSGTGRDAIIFMDKDFTHGKHHATGSDRTASVGRQCQPRKRTIGPKLPDCARLTELAEGNWRVSGQWAHSAKSPKALPKASSEASLEGARQRYSRTMEVFDAARRASNQFMTPEHQEFWRRGAHHMEGFEASHAKLLPLAPL